METSAIRAPHPAEAAQRAARALGGELAIEVRDLEKHFRIPERRIDSLKERFLHPHIRADYREHRALAGISFEVGRGEFFGVVGRNGSGKSTLLKILASIYRADRGEIFVSGRVAPLIELGVGFHPEFTARENVILNAVMMGLTPREARRRFDSVIDFAELHDFVDLKLKNYSSGMMVRLAFSVMVQVDADILLVDEILAVGDASFQEKCTDTFRTMREAGKTVVFVTHDMATVEEFCHRAILLDGGQIEDAGDPEKVGRKYLNLNFERAVSETAPISSDGAVAGEHVRVVDAWLEGEKGARATSVGQDEPIRLSVIVEAARELDQPILGFVFTSADGVQVFSFNEGLDPDAFQGTRLRGGERVRVRATIANPLKPDRYFVSCWVYRKDERGMALQAVPALDFAVYGTDKSPGVVSVSKEVELVRETPLPQDPSGA